MKNLSGLDLLAEAAIYCSNNQENNSSLMNCQVIPKKRNLYRYQAEQVDHKRASDKRYDVNSVVVAAADSNSSGYASSSREVVEEQSLDSSSSSLNSATASSSKGLEPDSDMDYELNIEHKKLITEKRSKRNTTKSIDSLVRACKQARDKTFSDRSIDMEKLKMKNEKKKETINDGFEEDLKIKVKTPKLTYTLKGMRKRKPSTKTPDDLKDEEYFEKRHRNNLAAKKSRNNKNLAIKTSVLRLEQLETEHDVLEREIGIEIMIMRSIKTIMENDAIMKENLLKLKNENKLEYFAKVLAIEF